MPTWKKGIWRAWTAVGRLAGSHAHKAWGWFVFDSCRGGRGGGGEEGEKGMTPGRSSGEEKSGRKRRRQRRRGMATRGRRVGPDLDELQGVRRGVRDDLREGGGRELGEAEVHPGRQLEALGPRALRRGPDHGADLEEEDNNKKGGREGARGRRGGHPLDQGERDTRGGSAFPPPPCRERPSLRIGAFPQPSVHPSIHPSRSACPAQSPRLVQLVRLGRPREERPEREELPYDPPDRKHVDGGRVVG